VLSDKEYKRYKGYMDDPYLVKRKKRREARR
jgi:hypothetical protein